MAVVWSAASSRHRGAVCGQTRRATGRLAAPNCRRGMASKRAGARANARSTPGAQPGRNLRFASRRVASSRRTNFVSLFGCFSSSSFVYRLSVFTFQFASSAKTVVPRCPRSLSIAILHPSATHQPSNPRLSLPPSLTPARHSSLAPLAPSSSSSSSFPASTLLATATATATRLLLVRAASSSSSRGIRY